MYADIDKLEKSKLKVNNHNRHYEAYMPFAIAALIVMLIGHAAAHHVVQTFIKRIGLEHLLIDIIYANISKSTQPILVTAHTFVLHHIHLSNNTPAQEDGCTGQS